MTDFTGFTAETERMLLRTYTDDDFHAFFDLHRREDVARYLPWHPRDEDAAREALARHQKLTIEVEGQGLTLAGLDKETGRLVGDFVLILRSVEHRRGEVGYALHPDFAGRGLATEGARLCSTSRSAGSTCAGSSAASTPATGLGPGAGQARAAARGAPGAERAVQGRVDRRGRLRDPARGVGGIARR